MKLSIITVSFNNREGLLLTAKSIACQTFHDFEWIVVDGGSSDGSLDIIEQFAHRMSWHVSEPDRGIYEAMNKGLAKARGEFVQFLNSGDGFLNSSVLERIFSEGLSDVNYGDQWCILNNQVIEERTYPDVLDLTYLFRSPLGHQASFIRTELAKAHPYHEEFPISADRCFFLELYLAGAVFHHLKFPVVSFDSSDIGSREDTRVSRSQQLQRIKEGLLPVPALRDFERLMKVKDDFDFIMRVPPLRWSFFFFKWLQKLKSRL